MSYSQVSANVRVTAIANQSEMFTVQRNVALICTDSHRSFPRTSNPYACTWMIDRARRCATLHVRRALAYAKSLAVPPHMLGVHIDTGT